MNQSGKKLRWNIKYETHLSFNLPKFSLVDFKFISRVYVSQEKVFNSALDLYNNICSKEYKEYSHTVNIHIQYITCPYDIPIKIMKKMHYPDFLNGRTGAQNS